MLDEHGNKCIFRLTPGYGVYGLRSRSNCNNPVRVWGHAFIVWVSVYLSVKWESLTSPCLYSAVLSQSRLTLCDPIDCSPSGSSVRGDSPGKNTRVGCHALLQGIFPTQGSNPGLLHCRLILHQLSFQGRLPW